MLCVLLGISVCAHAETPPPTGDAGYAEAGEVIFVDDEVTEIFVTMDPADLDAMLADPFDNTYRACTVRIVNSRIDDTVLDVAIRPRGNTSRNALKKSWKLKFNEFVPGREIRGLEKLNLNGHQNDVSIVRGKLAWDVYNAFGVPSPRASMVRLTINDGSLVDGVGDRMQVTAVGLTDRGDHDLERQGGEFADRRDPEPSEFLVGARPDAPERPQWQRRHELGLGAGIDLLHTEAGLDATPHHPWLGFLGRQFGDELG